jgi:hypothetical protein
MKTGLSLSRTAELPREEDSAASTDLWETLVGMIKNPIRSIVPPWSWKAAVFSATLRALTFFVTNLKSGQSLALRAMWVEAVYAIFAAGLAGAISQQLRRTKPLWGTLLVVLVALPGIFVIGQAGIHALAHTPRIAGGLIASYFLTSLSSGFSWYAMRHGAMLGGVDDTSIRHDLKALPAIGLGFVLAIPQAIAGTHKNRKD